MRIKPITEHEAEEASKPKYLLKEGECDFSVTQAQDQTSEAGNEMIKLTLEVWDANNKKAVVYDYLLDSIPHKLRHAAYACGIGHVYERGEIEASHFEGKGGRLIIRTKEQRGYNPKNEVKDYVIADRTKQGAGYQAAKNGGVAATPRRQAWEAFQKANPGKTADEIASLWKEELRSFFPDRTQESLVDADWRRFAERKTVSNPIGTEEQFKEDDIPF